MMIMMMGLLKAIIILTSNFYVLLNHNFCKYTKFRLYMAADSTLLQMLPMDMYTKM